jgi:hypothetical protein
LPSKASSSANCGTINLRKLLDKQTTINQREQREQQAQEMERKEKEKEKETRDLSDKKW